VAGAPGDEAEITLDTMPGQVIKAQVDSIIWAQSQGVSTNAGAADAARPPPGRFR
jgi:multidrug resistance efflux pump